MAPGIGNTVLLTPVSVPRTKQAATATDLHRHTLVTTDSNALQFHAPAFQPKSGRTQDNLVGPDSDGNSNYLITSPYNFPPHFLDLATLNTPNELLAKALTILQPTRPDYATAPYLESFNWTAVFGLLRQLSEEAGYSWKRETFYVVAFRSRLFPDASVERLTDLDMYSHQEASASGGLLKYWFGRKDGENRNLATCLWRSREDARNGGTGPWHRRARAEAKDLYEKIEFSMMELIVDDGVEEWEMRDWIH